MAWVMASRLIPVFVKFLPVFEPLTPTFLSFFIKRKLGEWKNQGLIADYEAGSKRLGKYHYEVAVDLELTPEQARNTRDLTISKVSKQLMDMEVIKWLMKKMDT